MTLLETNALAFVTIGIWITFLLLAGIYSTIRAFSLRRGWADKVGACLRLLAAFILNQGLAVVAMRRAGAELVGLDLFAEKWMTAVPAEVVVGVLTILTALEASIINMTDDYLKRRVSVNSIKEATDKMPSGILEYVESGRIILINPAMEKIVDMLFGEEEDLDGKQLWDLVEQESKKLFGETSDTPILMTEDESKAILFQRNDHTVEGVPVTEILAYDVTEAYAVSRKLMEENERLSVQRDKLMELGTLVDNVTREREMLEAKVRIHDELGSLLIATKRYLTGGVQTDREGIKTMWKNNLSLLQGREREQTVDEFAPVLKAAEDVGVQVKVTGEYPEEKEIREMLVFALRETLTNTVRHAEGDEIIFEINEEENKYHCMLSNNGKAPEEPITERGGLKHLREWVENYGGTMDLQSLPKVVLRLTFPK
ncbi:MAG: hypothetical protein IJI78_06085 [Oscillospiraceae bacterium]|nr:hypothetical protein [Oscillospiraceae bacterium]